MASVAGTYSARRSRRLAGLEPSNSVNGDPVESRKAVELRRSPDHYRRLRCHVHGQCGSVKRRVTTTTCNCLQNHRQPTSVQMVNRKRKVTSDTSSQTSDPGAETRDPQPGTSDPEQPSTSSSSLSLPAAAASTPPDGDMGSALSAARNSDANENEAAATVAARESRRSGQRRSRQRTHRALIEAYRGIPPSMPVKGESYCDCPRQGRDLTCSCGEEDQGFDWCWDCDQRSAACELSDERRMSIFHMSYSSGTAAVRGTQPMTDRQYFWEIKMTSPVYGTDMMVGVGTASVNLGAYRHAFTSLLGRDGESWGLSYYGRKQHKGKFEEIKGGKFGQGTILGVHVDMWHGTVSYYKNRRPLGVAYSGLAGKTLFPMVASTAARTAMKVIKACSFQTSLQFLCCQVLRKLIPSERNVIDALDLPPGLRAFLDNNLSWLLRPSELEREAAAAAAAATAAQKRRKRRRQKRRKRTWSERSSDSSSSSSGEDYEEEEEEEEDGEEEGGEGPPPAKRLRVQEYDDTDEETT